MLHNDALLLLLLLLKHIIYMYILLLLKHIIDQEKLRTPNCMDLVHPACKY